MFSTLVNAWKIKDIRTKMLYTMLLIVIYRLGSLWRTKHLIRLNIKNTWLSSSA